MTHVNQTGSAVVIEPTNHHQEHLVHIKINGEAKDVPAKQYKVSELKTLLGVPSEYALDVIKGQSLHPLDDNEVIKVHNNQEFVSHVRCGASS